MKIVTLTKGMTSKIDDKDVSLINKYRWYAHDDGNGRYYAISNLGANRKVYMHRFILGIEDRKLVDHINGDTLDNCRKNIRTCNSSQNSMNRRTKTKNTSGYRGVSWCKAKSRWIAEICVMKKRIKLGSFLNKEEAALAYNKHAVLFHKEFASLNSVSLGGPEQSSRTGQFL